MKNKKGFTLIELIAVIVIIGLIALIAIPFFTGSLEDFRKNFYVNLNTTFLSGGKEFFSDNSKYLPRRYLFAQKVALSTLQNEKYVKSFKDYKGNECDLENSYVIVVKLGDKSYEYVPCLKCPNDNYENAESKYCKPEWLDNGNIEHTLGNIGTLYIYKGTSREVLKERAKVRLDIVKYNGAREEVARVSGEGEEGIESISPSNLDIVDTNKVGNYTLDYTYQEKTIHGLVVVYENSEPIVIAKRHQTDKDKTKSVESTDTVANDSEYDNSNKYNATPDDVWAYELLYEISSDPLTVEEVRIVEYQWYIHGRWETFCKPTNGLSCTHIVDEEMNETVKFRSIDSLGNIGEVSRDYVVRIDRTKPTCTLSVPTADGNLDGATKWYRNDFNITFASKRDASKEAYGKNISSGLVNDYSKIAVNGTVLENSEITDTGTQTTDSSSFTWYGYVEDKAGNWYTCNSGNLKKDKTPPTCSLGLSGTKKITTSNWYTSNVTITMTDNDDTSGIKRYEVTTSATPTYNGTEKTAIQRLNTTGTTWYGYVEDKAGNTNSCNTSVQKDSEAPTCVTSGGNTTTTWTNGSITLTGKCTDTGGSNCVTDITQTYSTNTNNTYSPGKVSDNAGNETPCPEDGVYIDQTQPTCSIASSGTAGTNNWYVGNVTLTLTTSDTGGSNVSGYLLTKETTAGYTGTSKTASQTDDTTGTTWYGYVKDGAGNTNSCSIAVKKDTARPSCSFNGIASYTCSDTYGILKYYAGSDSTPTSYTNATSSGATTTSLTNNTAANAGKTAKYYIFAVDDAGNVSDPRFFRIFSYTGAVQTFSTPLRGKYKLEAYGGEGGKSLYQFDNQQELGGTGGYTTAQYTINSGITLYVAVGGKGTDGTYGNPKPSTDLGDPRQLQTAPGGWNGGGIGTWDGGREDYANDSPVDVVPERAGGGGGATHIATANVGNGLLSDYSSSTNQRKVLIAAGGGGGRVGRFAVGNGGGDLGVATEWFAGDGGNQYSGTYAGTVTCPDGGLTCNAIKGSFGKGQDGTTVGRSSGVGGGGGGWMGGATNNDASDANYTCSGVGGSGHVTTNPSSTRVTFVPETGTTTTSSHRGHGLAIITYLGQ